MSHELQSVATSAGNGEHHSPAPIRNSLPETRRAVLRKTLHGTLADLLDLASQFKQAHWNVKGNNFYALHLMLGQLSARLGKLVDRVAVRGLALGGLAAGSVRAAAAASRLPEPGAGFEQTPLLVELAEHLALAATQVRADIELCDIHGDAVSTALYTAVAAGLQQMLYLLESHLR